MLNIGNAPLLHKAKKKKCFEIVNIEHPEADQDLH